MDYRLPDDLEDPSINPPSRLEEAGKVASHVAKAAVAPLKGQALAVGLIIGYLLCLASPLVH